MGIGGWALAVAVAGGGMAVLSAQRGPVPHRVVDVATARVSDFDAMLGAVARADVVFVGEQQGRF